MVALLRSSLSSVPSLVRKARDFLASVEQSPPDASLATYFELGVKGQLKREKVRQKLQQQKPELVVGEEREVTLEEEEALER